MSLERKINDERVNQAKKTAPLEEVDRAANAHEVDVLSKFVEGKYDLNQLRELMGKLPDLGGAAVFETLPEFIYAVRQLGFSKEVQDEILDHENAHAVEALQRGYNIKYELHFTKDEKKDFIIKMMRTSISRASVWQDLFKKNGRESNEEELRTDLIAIATAPEILTNGELSDSDKRIANGSTI
jgi:hypothetical protein